MSGIIRNLKNPFTGRYLFPVTKTRGVYLDDGRNLDTVLRQGIMVDGDEELEDEVPRDSDLLDGHPSSYYASKSELGDVYSTEETIVGKWIDGKPLYRKTISIGSFPNTGIKNVQHNIQNIDTITKLYGVDKAPDGEVHPLPYIHVVDHNFDIMIYANLTNIIVRTATDRSNLIGYVTIEYTKTTD